MTRCLALLALLVATCAPNFAAALPRSRPVPGAVVTAGTPLSYRPGEVLVIVDERSALAASAAGRATASDARLAAALTRHGLAHAVPVWAGRRSIRGDDGAHRPHVLKLASDRPDFDPLAAARELAATGAVCAAAPNVRLRLFATIPNDSFYVEQWYLDSSYEPAVRLPDAWDVTQGSPSTVLAILDSGIDLGHPDLASRIWTNPEETPANGVDDDGNGLIDDVQGWDFGNADDDPHPEATIDSASGIDIAFHGTHVAGIAAAAANNLEGVAGADWNCRILALKVADSTGEFTLAAVSAALEYATDEGADIISMSFGGPDLGVLRDFFQPLVDAATSAGAVVVAAAGNSGTDEPTYPSACDQVIAVGATSLFGERAWFSNWGPWVDVCAPGESMFSTLCRNYEFDDTSAFVYFWLFGWDGTHPYMHADGTSTSCPLVAGICGLIRARYPDLSPAAVAAHLFATADSVAFDQPIGRKVNAYRAVTEPVVAVGAHSSALTLHGAPNPFTRSTRLALSLPAPGRVRVRVFDTAGRAVRELLDAELPAGAHFVSWDGTSDRARRQAPGLYLVRLEAAGEARTLKVVLAAR